MALDPTEYGVPPGAVRPARPRCAAFVGQLVKLGDNIKPAWKPCARAGRLAVRVSGIDLLVCKRCYAALGGGEDEPSPPPS